MTRINPFRPAVLALAFAGGLWSAAAAQEAGPVMTVTGQGEVTAAPDMATIRVGVSERAETAETAMNAVNRGSAALIERLEERGVAAHDIQTSDLSLRPIYARTDGMDEAASPAIIGFHASNRLMVRLRDIEEVGGVLQSLLEDGANEFEGLTFGLQDPRPLMDEARRLAISDARARAHLYAQAAGVELSEIREISEMDGRMPQPQMMEMASARMGDMAVAAGELSMTAEVQIVYGLGATTLD
ncbi:hypothetical protein SAMN05421688_2019 [Poseidonocella pacifica]|uniref:SIMPL domain-containing protein n=1 Tax=Poseidonocella pacifica TaxID=871651 RepID=A0A1I0XBA3_9RHOB|nr:SIMPL domain-containing protein [Poseidonocella pacifica]SFA97620.1 hypothetical protein SAMN05421688_2019 [Poseidonocella pacifica]